MTTGLAVEYAELHALAAALRWQAGQLADEALLLMPTDRPPLEKYVP